MTTKKKQTKKAEPSKAATQTTAPENPNRSDPPNPTAEHDAWFDAFRERMRQCDEAFDRFAKSLDRHLNNGVVWDPVTTRTLVLIDELKKRGVSPDTAADVASRIGCGPLNDVMGRRDWIMPEWMADDVFNGCVTKEAK